MEPLHRDAHRAVRRPTLRVRRVKAHFFRGSPKKCDARPDSRRRTPRGPSPCLPHTRDGRSARVADGFPLVCVLGSRVIHKRQGVDRDLYAAVAGGARRVIRDDGFGAGAAVDASRGDRQDRRGGAYLRGRVEGGDAHGDLPLCGAVLPPRAPLFASGRLGRRDARRRTKSALGG